MSSIDLSRYGLSRGLELSVESREFPATTADPREAPIVFLVDEDHLAQPAINASAANAGRIMNKHPDTVVALEFFQAGVRVQPNSVSEFRPPNFHVQLARLGAQELFGGDDIEAAREIDEVHTDYAARLESIDLDFRHLSVAERDKKRQELREEGRLAVRNHPGEFIRSRRMIESLLEMMGPGRRLGVINAGANHNSQILANVDPEGNPLFRQRSEVSFIRLRAVTELRQLAAYYHWVRRGRPLWDALVDWAWAEKKVEGLES